MKQEWEPSHDGQQAPVFCCKSKYSVGKRLWKGNCKDKTHGYADLIGNAIQVLKQMYYNMFS